MTDRSPNPGRGRPTAGWRSIEFGFEGSILSEEEIDQIAVRHGLPRASIEGLGRSLTDILDIGPAIVEADARGRADTVRLARLAKARRKLLPLAREIATLRRQMALVGEWDQTSGRDASGELVAALRLLGREVRAMERDPQYPFVHAPSQLGPNQDHVRRHIVRAALATWRKAGKPLRKGRDARGELIAPILAFLRDVIAAASAPGATLPSSEVLRSDLTDFLEVKPRIPNIK